LSIGRIVKVAGPLVIAEGMRDANMFDVVRVSEKRLIGEIIEMHGDRASVQVYEETAGLGTGERVESTGMPLSVELGPGLIKGIFDGIQRPLEKIREKAGNNLTRGIEVPSLDRDVKWRFYPTAEPGAKLTGGDVVGYVNETDVVKHKIMVPPGAEGVLVELKEGDYTVTDEIGYIQSENGKKTPLTLMQTWKQSFRPICPLLPVRGSSTLSSP